MLKSANNGPDRPRFEEERTVGSRTPMRSAKLALTVLSLAVAAWVVSGCMGDSDSKESDGPVTLTVWENIGAYSPETKKALDTIAAEFRKAHPNVRIKRETLPRDALEAKMRASIAAKSGADVVAMIPGIYAQDYRDGLIPLEDRLTDEQRESIPLMEESTSPDGHLYALPFTSYGYFILYNKALFKKAGLSGEPLETWPELVDACEKLKATGSVPIASGFKDGEELENYLYPLGGQLMTDADLEACGRFELPLTSEAFVGTFDAVVDLAQRGCFPEKSYAVTRFDDAYKMFHAGKAAMLLEYGYPAEIETSQKDLGKENLGVMMVPRLENSKRPPFVDQGPGTGFGVTSWSDHPNEAWDFVSFLTSQRGQQIMWDIGGFLPNHHNVRAKSPNEAVQYVLDALQNPNNSTIYMGVPAPVVQEIRRLAPVMIKGDTTSADALEQLEQKRSSLEGRYGP
jgi:ABC-type glycerol-3-phosphate transport system substrate-binding protein